MPASEYLFCELTVIKDIVDTTKMGNIFSKHIFATDTCVLGASNPLLGSVEETFPSIEF